MEYNALVDQILKISRNTGVSKKERMAEIKKLLASQGHTTKSFRNMNMERNNHVAQLARNFAQGVAFGFSDEIEAFIKSRFNENKDYDGILKEIQGGMEAYRSVNPVKAGSAEVAGAFAFPVGAYAGMRLLPRAIKMAPKTKATGPVRNIATATGVGAVEGGLYGAGTAKQGERMEGAKEGAQYGAGFSGGLRTGIEGGKKIYKTIKGSGSGGGGKIPPGGSGGMDDLSSSDRRAMTRILEAVYKDGGTLEDLIIKLDEYAKTGKESVATLSDIGGKSVQKLALGSVMKSSKAENIASELSKRGENSKLRAVDDLLISFGKEKISIPEFKKTRIEEMLANSQPLYRNAEFVVENGRRMDRLVEDPELARYLANEIDGISELETAWKETVKRMKVKGVQLGDTPEGIMNVRTVDQFKKRLDAKIKKLEKDGDLDFAGSLKKIRRTMLKGDEDKGIIGIDNLVEDYAQARRVYAGEANLNDAFDLGKKAVGNMTDDDVLFHLNELKTIDGESAHEMFKLGMVQELVRLARQNKTKSPDIKRLLVGSPDIQSKVKIAFDDEDSFLEFMKRMDMESEMFENAKKQITGSPTTPRLEAVQGLDMTPTEIASLATQTASGGFTPASLAPQAVKSFMENQKENLAESLAPRLLQQGTARQTVQELIQRQMDIDRAIEANRRAGIFRGPASTVLPAQMQQMYGGLLFE